MSCCCSNSSEENNSITVSNNPVIDIIVNSVKIVEIYNLIYEEIE